MFHPGLSVSRGDFCCSRTGVSGGSMRKMALLAFAGILLPGVLLSNQGFSQQPQPAQRQPAQKPQQHAANLDVGNVPTASDMYCSGYITTEKVPDKLFVAGGHNSPDQTRFAGVSDTIFIHGQGMKEGDRYQIVR